MLIFSEIDNNKKFIEIDDIKECDKIMADSFVLIRIKSNDKNHLESRFKLGRELKQNEIDYAIYIDEVAKITINSAINFFDATNYYGDKINYYDKEKLPLNLILLMFAQCGASFCIIDERNKNILPFAQNIVNHYLLDMKILSLVESYMQIQDISYWLVECRGISVEPLSIVEIGIDGVVEKNLLILK